MRLNEVEETLSPGQGKVDLFGFAQGWGRREAGIGLDYEHRFDERWSAFAKAKIAKSWGSKADLIWDTMFGVRLKF